MPVYGEPYFCNDSCSWHKIEILKRRSEDIEACGAEVLDTRSVFVNINMIEPHLDILNFKNPWKLKNTSRVINMREGFNRNVWFVMGETQLVTSSHQLGGIDAESIERKLSIQEVRQVPEPMYPGPFFSGIDLLWVASGAHPQTQRIYVSATETMSKVGGCANALLVSFLLLYGLYHGKLLKRDIIHKGLTLSGKFGLSESRLGEFADFYRVKNYKLAESQEKHGKEYCCKRKIKPESNGDGVEPSLEDDRILDKAFDNMMARQLDFKHIMQISQDVEIIKKVLFHKRHILLGPIIALENEKRALLASCQDGFQQDMNVLSPHQGNGIYSDPWQVNEHQMKVDVSHKGNPVDPLNDSQSQLIVETG